MLLKVKNRVLIENSAKTILTAAVSASGTTLTVENNTGFANTDYIIIGRIGDDKTEVRKIGAAVTAGTSLTVDALVFSHDIDTPVYRIAYNQVEFSHATTSTGSKTVMTTSSITPDREETVYEDTTYTTGYGFARFKNETSANYSVYSGAFPYTGRTKKMMCSIRKKVRRLIDETTEEKVTDDDINDEINTAQSEFSHEYRWPFYEKTKSFSAVADQFEYSLASNVDKLYDASFDTQPLVVDDLSKWEMRRWDTDVSGDPTNICMWGNKARVYPYPSSSADTTTLGAAVTTTTETTLTVASSSSFPEQGRVIVDSEVISYTGKTSTTLTGCSRGEEGTTAATHSNGATVTERNFIYHFQEEPEDLDDEMEETSVPEPNILAVMAALELTTDKNLYDRLLIKKEMAIKKMKAKYGKKFGAGFGRVKDVSETNNDSGILRNPNDYPKNLS